MEGSKENPGTSSEGEAARLTFGRQVALMVRTIIHSPAGKSVILLLVAIVLVVAAVSYGQIRLNGWNKPFYDALSRRDLRDFLFELGVFFVITGITLTFNVAQRWLIE